MNIYRLPTTQIDSIKGEFVTITSDSAFVYVQSEQALQAPFEQADLPQSYKDILKENLDYEKIKATNKMNKACDKALSKLESKALGKPYIYDMTQEDQINLMGLLIAGIDSFFRCASIDDPYNKQNVPHTKEQLKTLYADALAFKSKMLFMCGEKKDAISKATTIEAVKAIKWDEQEGHIYDEQEVHPVDVPKQQTLSEPINPESVRPQNAQNPTPSQKEDKQ